MAEKKKARISVLVVGTGGTGTALLSTLTQMLSNYDGDNVALGICDGDIVEKKNLARQIFSDDQIGMNKATAIAETILESRGVKVCTFTNFLEDERALDAAFARLDSTTGWYLEKVHVLVSCVDNLKTRDVFEKWFSGESTCVYVDSANEEYHGEVVYAVKNKRKIISPPRSKVFPSFKSLLKKEVKNLKFRSEQDCLTRSISSPQHITTNKMAGLLCAGALIRLIECGQVPTGVDFFSVSPVCSVSHQDTSLLADKSGGEKGGKAEKNKKAKSTRKPNG